MYFSFLEGRILSITPKFSGRVFFSAMQGRLIAFGVHLAVGLPVIIVFCPACSIKPAYYEK
jgi:hypothetical protein